MFLKSVAFGILVVAASGHGAMAATLAAKPLPASVRHVPARPAVAAKPAVAPADEYFGRMKLSILGISNTIHDTKLREGFDPVHAAVNFDKLSLAEDALEDWSNKYPHDTWLPGKAYYMSHEFWAMDTPEANVEAERCRTLLFAHFATSSYAQRSRSENAVMFAPPAPPAPVAAAAASSATTTAAGETAAAPAPQSAASPHP